MARFRTRNKETKRVPGTKQLTPWLPATSFTVSVSARSFHPPRMSLPFFHLYISLFLFLPLFPFSTTLYCRRLEGFKNNSVNCIAARRGNAVGRNISARSTHYILNIYIYKCIHICRVPQLEPEHTMLGIMLITSRAIALRFSSHIFFLSYISSYFTPCCVLEKIYEIKAFSYLFIYLFIS